MASRYDAVGLRWLRTAAAALLSVVGVAARAQPAMVATSPGLFEYHSGFWLNLHHLLYEQARARRGLDTSRAIVRAALADTSGIGRLTQAQRQAWDAALRYYEAHLAARDVLDRDMARLKTALGDRNDAPTLGDAPVGDSLRVVLDGAAPAYRAVWWARHDAGNRAWVAMLAPQVATHGAALARELTRIFATRWSGFLIRLDASAYANWAGAYTTMYPDRITVATRDPDYGGTSALEMVFHESLHTMDDSLRVALQAAAERRGRQLPGDFTHAVIFFTAGEVTRRRVPGYEPYAARLGIWRRGTFPTYLPILREHWLPWIEGRTTFDAAVDGMARALP